VSNGADFNNPATGKSRIVYGQNFDPSTSSTSDLFGHGTHVAGIIAGNGANSICGNCDVTIRGIAPKASVVNLRALDANGQATDSTVIAAIQQAIALKSQYNIRVMNLSLGRGVFESYTTDPLCQAVEQAWQRASSSWWPPATTAATIPATTTATAPSPRRATSVRDHGRRDEGHGHGTPRR